MTEPAPAAVEIPRRPVHADPDFGYEYDEDGEKDQIAAGWGISFGCRLNVVQDRDGAPYVSVSMSDQDLRNGCSIRSTTREQIRQFAYHLLKLTEEMGELGPQETPGLTPRRSTAPMCGLPAAAPSMVNVHLPEPAATPAPRVWKPKDRVFRSGWDWTGTIAEAQPERDRYYVKWDHLEDHRPGSWTNSADLSDLSDLPEPTEAVAG